MRIYQKGYWHLIGVDCYIQVSVCLFIECIWCGVSSLVITTLQLMGYKVTVVEEYIKGCT